MSMLVYLVYACGVLLIFLRLFTLFVLCATSFSSQNKWVHEQRRQEREMERLANEGRQQQQQRAATGDAEGDSSNNSIGLVASPAAGFASA